MHTKGMCSRNSELGRILAHRECIHRCMHSCNVEFSWQGTCIGMCIEVCVHAMSWLDADGLHMFTITTIVVNVFYTYVLWIWYELDANYLSVYRQKSQTTPIDKMSQVCPKCALNILLTQPPRCPDQFVVLLILKQGWTTTIFQGKRRRTWVLVCYLFQTLPATAYNLNLDGFIDDQDPELDESLPWQPLSWRDLSDREEGLGKFLDGILEHSHNARQEVPIAGNNVEDTFTSIVDTERSPMLSDYPLWRVCCRVSLSIISIIIETYSLMQLGLEEEAIFFLLQMASSQHQLWSAFMCGSIHGWIYLETLINEDLNRLLKCMPGIVQQQNGVIWEQVDFGDWTKMLTMVDSQTSIGVGKWAQVCRGLYKGDIGYVSAVENWSQPSLGALPATSPTPWNISFKEKMWYSSPWTQVIWSHCCQMQLRLGSHPTGWQLLQMQEHGIWTQAYYQIIQPALSFIELNIHANKSILSSSP